MFFDSFSMLHTKCVHMAQIAQTAKDITMLITITINQHINPSHIHKSTSFKEITFVLNRLHILSFVQIILLYGG